MNKCISCIKDGKTGECYDVKDKRARELITEIQNILDTLTGVTGGNLATDQDIATLQGQITLLNEFKTELEEGLPARLEQMEDSSAQAHQDIATTLITYIDNKVTELNETIINITGADFSQLATKEEVNAVQTQVTEISNFNTTLVEELNVKFEEISDEINAGDQAILNGIWPVIQGTYIDPINEHINEVEQGFNTNIEEMYNEIGMVQGDISNLQETVNGLTGLTLKTETFTSIKELYNKINSLTDFSLIEKLAFKPNNTIYITEQDGLKLNTTQTTFDQSSSGSLSGSQVHVFYPTFQKQFTMSYVNFSYSYTFTLSINPTNANLYGSGLNMTSTPDFKFYMFNGNNTISSGTFTLYYWE